MQKQYLSIKEASERLGVSTLTLRNWDKSGKLSASRHPINNYRVYLADELDQIMKKIDEGEKPIKHSRVIQNIKKDTPISYNLKVIHMKD